MKILKPGLSYGLIDFQAGTHNQRLHFIDMEPVSEGSSKLKTVRDGTTNEEILLVLLDRLDHQGAKMPCKENIQARESIQDALNALEARTARRKAEQVEGTMALAEGDSLPAGSTQDPEAGEQDPIIDDGLVGDPPVTLDDEGKSDGAKSDAESSGATSSDDAATSDPDGLVPPLHNLDEPDAPTAPQSEIDEEAAGV